MKDAHEHEERKRTIAKLLEERDKVKDTLQSGMCAPRYAAELQSRLNGIEEKVNDIGKGCSPCYFDAGDIYYQQDGTQYLVAVVVYAKEGGCIDQVTFQFSHGGVDEEFSYLDSGYGSLNGVWDGWEPPDDRLDAVSAVLAHKSVTNLIDDALTAYVRSSRRHAEELLSITPEDPDDELRIGGDVEELIDDAQTVEDFLNEHRNIEITPPEDEETSEAHVAE